MTSPFRSHFLTRFPSKEEINRAFSLPLLTEEWGAIKPLLQETMTPLEKAAAIQDWTRKRLPFHDQPRSKDDSVIPEQNGYTGSNASLLLKTAENPRVRFLCGHYAVLLIAMLQRAGIPARMVLIGTDEGHGHTLAEAWCGDDYGWIGMDPMFNAVWIFDGKPCSCLTAVAKKGTGRFEARQFGEKTPPLPNNNPLPVNVDETGRLTYEDYLNYYAFSLNNHFLDGAPEERYWVAFKTSLPLKGSTIDPRRVYASHRYQDFMAGPFFNER